MTKVIYPQKEVFSRAYHAVIGGGIFHNEILPPAKDSSAQITQIKGFWFCSICEICGLDSLRKSYE